MPASSFVIPAKAGIHCGRYLGPPTATDLPGYLQDAAISRISARDPPNEWPLPLAEREQHLDPTTRIPASPVPPQGLDKPERRVELHLRRFGRRARQRLAEYRRRDPALERFAVRTQDHCALLLPIEALRHRGDGLPRRRLVRPHFRIRALGRRASPAPLRRRGLPRDGWVNGMQLASHEGGHTPFSADVTYALAGEARENVVVVRAEDPSRDVTIPRGKQYWKERSEGIFYTRTTGIWQTVWLEPVNRRRIDSLRLTPDVDAASIEVEVSVIGIEPGMSLRAKVELDGEQVLEDTISVGSSLVERSLPLLRRGEAPDTPHLADWPGPALWSPEHPNLYDLRLELLDPDGEVLDRVESYFGMRKIEAKDGKVFLNDRPLYQRLVLDQGYFPDGILTAPTDEDLRRDVELA